MLKRIINFDKNDWKHMRFLLKNLLIQMFIKFDWQETKETCWWIRIHLEYDSTRVK